MRLDEKTKGGMVFHDPDNEAPGMVDYPPGEIDEVESDRLHSFGHP